MCIRDRFLHGLFQHPFQALAQGEILAIVMIALFLGIAVVVGGERYRLSLIHISCPSRIRGESARQSTSS